LCSHFSRGLGPAGPELCRNPGWEGIAVPTPLGSHMLEPQCVVGPPREIGRKCFRWGCLGFDLVVRQGFSHTPAAGARKREVGGQGPAGDRARAKLFRLFL
jgi:hypothetical protein